MAKKNPLGTLNGSSIKNVRTIKSWYDQNSVELTDSNGVEYRLGVDQILRLVKQHTFEKEKKVKYVYLNLQEGGKNDKM